MILQFFCALYLSNYVILRCHGNMTSHALCCYLEYFHIVRVFGVCTF